MVGKSNGLIPVQTFSRMPQWRNIQHWCQNTGTVLWKTDESNDNRSSLHWRIAQRKLHELKSRMDLREAAPRGYCVMVHCPVCIQISETQSLSACQSHLTRLPVCQSVCPVHLSSFSFHCFCLSVTSHTSACLTVGLSCPSVLIFIFIFLSFHCFAYLYTDKTITPVSTPILFNLILLFWLTFWTIYFSGSEKRKAAWCGNERPL